ncbi:MAG: tRNA pseudouridine(38-40) synthase TruA [Pirellulales bacterium]
MLPPEDDVAEDDLPADDSVDEESASNDDVTSESSTAEQTIAEQGGAGEPERRCYKLIISYDGLGFAGWQRQTAQRTVQEELEKAIAVTTGDEKVTLLAGSRTDTGVHAIGQCATFRSSRWNAPAHRLALALNTKLPNDVAVRAASEVPMTFSPIKHAMTKRYRYMMYSSRINNPLGRGNSWWVKRQLDVDAMRKAAEALIGEHDFLSFQTTGSPRKKTIRRVDSIDIASEPYLDGRLVTIEVEANGFLYNMMRNIAGSLMLVGVKQRSVEWMGQALAAMDRRAAGPTAPPYGLCLLRINYDPEREK